jgi:alpha-1,3-rhamnosyl/mannosyltransferase
MVGHSGIGTYLRGLLSGFDPAFLRDLVLLGDPARLAAYPCRVEPADEPIYGPAEQLAMPRRLKKLGPALFHCPHYNIPALYGGPMVATVHDLNHLLFPEFARSRFAYWYTRAILPALFRRARRIMADSECTRRDLLKAGAPAEKTVTVLLAPDEACRPVDEAAARAAAARHGLTPGYFLYVGNLRPIKNIPGLLRAYARLRARRPDAPTLALAGRDQMGSAAPADGVRRLGEVPAADLPGLYGAAGAFVFPSFHEGFGLPPLEAMACGAPVVASTGGSLPEILGDAALLVDPGDTDGLAAAMERVWTEPTLRADLARRGRERAASYSWKETARRTTAAYEEALR